MIADVLWKQASRHARDNLDNHLTGTQVVETFIHAMTPSRTGSQSRDIKKQTPWKDERQVWPATRPRPDHIAHPRSTQPDLDKAGRHVHLLLTRQRQTPSTRPPTLNAQTVRGIPTGRLTGADNLDDLPAPEAEVTRNGVLLEDAGQLGLLEAVAAQQGRLLIAAKDNVARHELVVGNVDKQVVLEEALNLGQRLDRSQRLARRGRQGHVGHHDARLVVVGDDVLCEIADLRDTERLVRQELDPDRAAVGRGIRVGVGGGRGVFVKHAVARAG